ncbi:MAG TPA: orotate phosphoribosyltransferase [Deltaproteobacteria bacterium]|nr:orotate phosphoribosyltransferase [Deltaproteobacteria bacterium]
MGSEFERLVGIIYRRSFRYDPAKGFVLSSGARSDIYIDVKKTVLSAEGMVTVGRVVYERIKGLGADGIGGLTLGADPIAYAAAMTSNLAGDPLEVFIVRKEAKKHGTMRWIEGNLGEGARVVVVDDVVTTGASTIKAVEKAREAGFEVVKVLALVDRCEGGRENIERTTGCAFEAVVSREDLLRLRP